MRLVLEPDVDLARIVCRGYLSELNNRSQLENRQIHADDDTADNNAQKRHNHGFKQTGQGFDGIIHFLFKPVRNLAQHGINGT